MPHAACLEYFIDPLLVDVEAPASVGSAKANGTLIRQHGNHSQSKAKQSKAAWTTSKTVSRGGSLMHWLRKGDDGLEGAQ